MSFVNICRDNNDPFYRYKMPLIVSKIEGRGNGIRTAIMNTSDVARALSRPPVYIIKFFGFELGAQTSINEADDRYHVNGSHDSPKLQDLLDGFITKFVLCKACKNPETDIIVQKDGTLFRDCKACGKRTSIDLKHKLASYIAKNPPSTAKQGKKKAAATASANTGAADLNEEVNGSGSKSPADHNSDDEFSRFKAEASGINVKDDGDDGWAADLSAEAVKARQKENEQSLNNLKLDDEDSDNSKFEEFGEWVADEDAEHTDVEIYKKAIDLGIAKKHRTVQVLAQTLFTEDIVDEIEEHAGLLKKLVTGEKHQKALLGGIERFVGLTQPELVSKIPKILHALYDEEILEEEIIISWGSKASKKYVDKDISKKVRKAARPFIEWLEQAESESESD